MRAILNFAKGAWYPAGQARLEASLRSVGFLKWDDHFIAFTDESQFGAPTHQEVPYAFKPYLIDWARQKGYEQILWADAAVWAQKDVEPVFDVIRRLGYYFVLNTVCGYWCSDVCLSEFGIDREESFAIPMLMGCFMGFDLTNPRTLAFCDDYLRLAKEERTFQGSHHNYDLSVSKDPRVTGHRHDQSVASLLALKYGMPMLTGPDFQYKLAASNPTYQSRAIFLTAGM